jgi:predicted dehydrogenase
MRPKPRSRRDFLARSTTSVLALSGLAAQPRGARAAGPNDSITLGFIGTGGMGTGLLNIFKEISDVRVAAVCDVYEKHALEARDLAGNSPDVYADFRKILDRQDIDAVVVATPDHWHCIPSVMACQAGKDVYCEKPLAYTIGESRLMADAAAKHKRITQMGNLIHASETYHRVAEIVQSGVLGKIPKVRIWMARHEESLGHPSDEPPPAGCEYDFWLGPAPKRPFNENRFTFNWRFFWDYGGGLLEDFICHLLDPVHWGTKAVAPETILADGRRVSDDNAETPDTLEVLYHYPEGFDLIWSMQDHNARGFFNRPAGFAFYGARATLHAHYNDYKILPEKGEDIVEPEPTLPRSPGHHREWLDAIKSRQLASCNFTYGHEITTVGHLGNIALRTGKKLTWDKDAERFQNADDANAYLFRPEYRAPWRLPSL